MSMQARREISPVATSIADKRLERRFSDRWAVLPLVLLDVLCIALSMAAAYVLRFIVLDYQAEFSAAFYLRLGIPVSLSWAVIFAFYSLYDAEYHDIISKSFFGLCECVGC